MARAGIKTEADLEKLVGWKCLKGVGRLLAHLHEHHDCPNRPANHAGPTSGANAPGKLHYDEYAALLLFYFFNATVTSLRDIRRLTEFKKFRRKLGVKCTSLGSLSEASLVFDPELLHGIFKDLAGKAAATDAPSRPKGFPADLDLIARDGSVFEALPRMVWALWLPKELRRRPSSPRLRYTQGDSRRRGGHDRADVREGAAEEAQRRKGGCTSTTADTRTTACFRR